MKIKKNLKRFFTLSRGNEGFTLVELIVVIAILAILAGVAVPAYSGYIAKTHMAADQTLVADVANALSLNYYNNGCEGVNAAVVLTPNGAFVSKNEEFVGEAMTATFGADWANFCKLTYDGWESEASVLNQHFTSSSFNGNTDKLMGTVNDLSGTLAGFLGDNPDALGDTGLGAYLNQNGITGDTESANGAVFYIASEIKDLPKEQKEIIVNALVKIGTDALTGSRPQDAISAAANTISSVTNSSIVTCSILYAYAEAYTMYEGNPSNQMNVDTTNIDNGGAALRAITAGFVNVINKADIPTATKYFQDPGTQAKTDAWAVLSAMDLVDNVSGDMMGDLSNENLFDSANTHTMVNNYLSAAESSIIVAINKDGKIKVSPEDVLG